jgi:glucosylceramidase
MTFSNALLASGSIFIFFGCTGNTYVTSFASSKINTTKLSSSQLSSSGSNTTTTTFRSFMTGSYCMDAQNGGTYSGTQLQLWGCFPGNVNQNFYYDSGTNQIHAYGSSSSLCVADSGYSASGKRSINGQDGNAVQLEPCGSGSEQRWTLDSTHNEVINRFSGKCLDVTNNSNSNGTALQLWSCFGGANQQWSFASPVTSTILTKFQSFMQGNLCIDAQNGGTYSGTQLQLWGCFPGNVNQNFYYDSGTNQIHAYGSSSSLCVADSGVKSHSGKAGSSGQDGNLVQLEPCGAGAEQRWTLDSTHNEVISQLSGKCLDVTNNNNSNGTALQLWSCFGGANQQWSFSSTSNGGPISAFMSSADQSNLLSPQPDLSFTSDSASGKYVIHVNESIRYQQMVGFGASITDGTAWLLKHALSASATQSLMTKLFDPILGIGLSFLRQPIGASDLSASVYSYEDTPGQFSIAHDTADSILLVKQALALNPKLQIMGTPWSPPAWMQNNSSMMGGALLQANQQNFAQYLVNTVQAWQHQGIPVYAVTMQNEPRYVSGGYPTSAMSLFPSDNSWPSAPVNQQDLLKTYVGPSFARAGLNTKILALDHNWDLTSQVLTMLGDPETRKYSGGVAFHCYGGNVMNSAAIRQQYPDQDLYSTECSSGTWTSWSDQFTGDASSWIISSIRLGSRAVLKWGLVLDDNHGPHLGTGSCSTCIGAAVVHNTSNGGYTGTWDLDRDYYILGQISKFVQPGAYRIESDQSADSVIQDVAFQNTDGTKVLYVFNSSSSRQNFAVQTSSGSFNFSIPSQSVVTFKW